MLLTLTLMLLLTDGEPGGGVRLLPDGSHPERRETVPPQHLQENQKGWLQRAAGAEVHPQASCITGAGELGVLK